MISTAKFVMVGCLLLVVAGCDSGDPLMTPVNGTVTLDGQPRAELEVSFMPKSGGVVSTGITDASGNYELTYDDGRKKGALIGSHVVRITSAAGGGEAGGDEAVAPIRIPAIYNTASTAIKDVAAGDNTIDLEIKTK